ncbi:MAG: adenylosuccinate synthase [Candidatus Latescibacteria bacterium]|jgi:adenylosuccinate synthase|nr:adenylosuccinate synthase [Candidatus Latescibacterota bacterium]MBT5831914.1 adenylosuccinate synthase [Candidatus Latescibacterota bacterium]
MAVRIVLGAQWGDEGKAKIVDYLTTDSDVVVRYQGGANAGHTIKAGDLEFVFHLIPAGIVHQDKACVVGNGVVLDPAALFQEVDELESKGISVDGRLFVSDRAHLVLPYHKAVEEANEKKIGDSAIGTTLRGIGPTYQDKINRSTGIRVGDLLDAELLPEKIRANVREKNEILKQVYGVEGLEEVQLIEEYMALGERLTPYITDTSVYLNDAIEAGKSILFEGSQGTLLDIDHGSYPYVTSSNTTAGGACTGAGIGPMRVNEVVGVVKAYTTRVGNGPFPTELNDEMGQRIRDIGHEYGATTGRPRRCGWLDVVMLGLARRINGLSSMAVTRVDILDELEEIKICTHYERNGQRVDHFPGDLNVLAECKPVYETLPGWQTPTPHIRSYGDLPENARRYLERVSELSRIPISIVSVGPDREETIVV